MSEHVQKEYSILQIALNLTATCFVSGAIIATLYFFTHPLAIQQEKITQQNTMKALVADAEDFKAVDGKEGWYTAEKGGETVAYVVPSETKGYGGTIKLMVAIDKDNKVINYDIISANETPGLGDNAAKEPFKKQFRSKGSDDLVVTKDPSNTKNIQAMTGATISSKAVTKGVKQAVDEVAEFAGGAK